MILQIECTALQLQTIAEAICSRQSGEKKIRGTQIGKEGWALAMICQEHKEMFLDVVFHRREKKQ